MTADSSLTSAFLLLARQIKQLEHLLATKQEQLTDLIRRRQQLDRLHAECERDIEAMITPLPLFRTADKGEIPAFKLLLRRSWALKKAHEKQSSTIYRLEQRIKRLQGRIEASLALKTKAVAAIKTGGGSYTLQSAIEAILAKNLLWGCDSGNENG